MVRFQRSIHWHACFLRLPFPFSHACFLLLFQSPTAQQQPNLAAQAAKWAAYPSPSPGRHLAEKTLSSASKKRAAPPPSPPKKRAAPPPSPYSDKKSATSLRATLVRLRFSGRSIHWHAFSFLTRLLSSLFSGPQSAYAEHRRARAPKQKPSPLTARPNGSRSYHYVPPKTATATASQAPESLSFSAVKPAASTHDPSSDFVPTNSAPTATVRLRGQPSIHWPASFSSFSGSLAFLTRLLASSPFSLFPPNLFYRRPRRRLSRQSSHPPPPSAKLLFSARISLRPNRLLLRPTRARVPFRRRRRRLPLRRLRRPRVDSRWGTSLRRCPPIPRVSSRRRTPALLLFSARITLRPPRAKVHSRRRPPPARPPPMT